MEQKKHVIKICRSESCRNRGGSALLAIAEEEAGENCTVEATGCFGYCTRGPIVKVDDTLYEGVTEADFRAILDRIR